MRPAAWFAAFPSTSSPWTSSPGRKWRDSRSSSAGQQNSARYVRFASAVPPPWSARSRRSSWSSRCASRLGWASSRFLLRRVARTTPRALATAPRASYTRSSMPFPARSSQSQSRRSDTRQPSIAPMNVFRQSCLDTTSRSSVGSSRNSSSGRTYARLIGLASDLLLSAVSPGSARRACSQPPRRTSWTPAGSFDTPDATATSTLPIGVCWRC